MAMGSASELESHLLLARDLGYLPAAHLGGLVNKTVEVKKMLTGFMQHLKTEG
jgi:four helix bundle protein